MSHFTRLTSRLSVALLAATSASCAQSPATPTPSAESEPTAGGNPASTGAFVEVNEVGRQPASHATKTRQSLCLPVSQPETISALLPSLYAVVPDHWLGAGRYKAIKIVQYKLPSDVAQAQPLDYAVLYFALSDPWTPDAPKEVRASFAQCGSEYCDIAAKVGEEYVLLLYSGQPQPVPHYKIPFSETGISFGRPSAMFHYVPAQAGWTNGEIGSVQAVDEKILRESVVTALGQLAKTGTCTVDLAPQSPPKDPGLQLDEPAKSEDTTTTVSVDVMPGGETDAGATDSGK